MDSIHAIPDRRSRITYWSDLAGRGSNGLFQFERCFQSVSS
jgi:hypothetical protein